MYRTILAPLDGSRGAEEALPSAVALAQKMGARLVLVRVATQPSQTATEGAEAQLETAMDAETYLADVASMLTLQYDLTVDTVVPFGQAAAGILLEIQQSDADLVVMTTHGRSGLSRLFFGSVAEAVLHHSPAPVWLIRANQGDTPAIFRQVHPRILVPLDGSPFSEAALPHALEVARVFDGVVALLRVVIPPVAVGDLALQPSYLSEELFQYEIEAARQYLTTLAASLKPEGRRIETLVRLGAAAPGIIQASQIPNTGLVVMTTHGRTGLRRVLLGSVALEVLQRCQLPVLLVRATEQAAPSEAELTASAL